MHPSAHAWATSALTPGEVRKKHVLEAGAYDVNGSVRPHVTALGPASYTGTDVQPGPGVDLVADAAKLPAADLPGAPDVVICTEMLEHAADWRAAMAGMIQVLAPGGLLVLTTRSEGFPYHGYPEDHWRFSVDAMQEILTAAGLVILECVGDPDPASPGVFASARKPDGWKWPGGTPAKVFSGISGVTEMTDGAG